MEHEQLALALLGGSAVLLVAVAAVRVSVHAGVPSLLLYLGIGVLLGSDGLGLDFNDARLAQDLGLIALALILAEGGLTTRWADIRSAVPMAAGLATVGVGVSVTVTAVAAKYVLDVDWGTASLMGAIVSSTDAAAVFSTLRAVRLPRRLTSVLEAESGFNDAPIVILVSLLAAKDGTGVAEAAGTISYELAAGAAVGLVTGVAASWALRRAALPAAGLYPIATMAFAVASYAAATSAHASGFLAVYLTSLWVANAPLPHRRATLGFAEGIGWLAQIGLFVMLGLLVTPARLGSAILPALAIGAVLLLVARPLSVAASLTPFRIPWRDQALLSWAGLRGAVPIVLTTVPLTTGVHGSDRIFDVVFVLVVVFTLVQAPLLAPLAERLALTRPGEARELTVESAPLDEMQAQLLQIRVPPTSRLHLVEIWELRLPADAAVTLIVRGGHAFVPEPTTMLERGDSLLVVTTNRDRAATEARLRAVDRSGKLARWFQDRGAE